MDYTVQFTVKGLKRKGKGKKTKAYTTGYFFFLA
jgi:hypothetical protein